MPPFIAICSLILISSSFIYFYNPVEDKEKIIIAVDKDEAGLALQQELVRRLGADVCYLVNYEDCKDANEYLLKYGKEKLKNCLSGATPVPLENVTTFKDIEAEITDFVKNGFKKGYQVGLHNFDNIFYFRKIPFRFFGY